MLSILTLIVLLAPLMAAFLIAASYLCGNASLEVAEKPIAKLSQLSIGLSFFALLVLDFLVIPQGGQLLQLGSWMQSGPFQVGFTFYLDALSLLFASLVAFLSLLTTRFSVHYLHREAGFLRFFMILNLFCLAMLIIVLSGNAVMTFIGWELAGVCSYLLIAYAYDRETSTANATQAFITNRIGDAGFLLAIILSFFWFGSVSWQEINTQGTTLGSFNVGLLGFGFMLAAFVKSAQIPFTGWISKALEGPTPSSAIFYGAVMVHAGVYLIIRLEPLISHSQVLMLILLLVGGMTAIYGFLTGLVQSDIKSSLIYSTVAQVGIMFLWCGLGLFTVAAWHLGLHAIWKLYQFLTSPAWMFMVSRSARPVPGWMARHSWLFTASLRRFWLDEIADWLFAQPTQQLAKDVRQFDEEIMMRMSGLPAQLGSSLLNHRGNISPDSHFSQIGTGRGVLGRVMEEIARVLEWFEERLVLQRGSNGMMTRLRDLGNYLLGIEDLLSQPRYLLLLIAAAFIVIL